MVGRSTGRASQGSPPPLARPECRFLGAPFDVLRRGNVEDFMAYGFHGKVCVCMCVVAGVGWGAHSRQVLTGAGGRRLGSLPVWPWRARPAACTLRTANPQPLHHPAPRCLPQVWSELSDEEAAAARAFVRRVEATWGVRFEEGYTHGLPFMAHAWEPLRCG